ncbi:MAG: type IV pilus biogenesis/stability protein PilW [Anaerolineae bacterium]
MTPGIRNKLRTAARVAESGKIPAAIELYRELIAENEDLADAWIGLGDILPNQTEQAEAYQKALAIDPKNSDAIQKLAIAEGKEPPQINILKKEEKERTADLDGATNETALTETPAAVEAEVVKSDTKVEPNVGGMFSHPIDISEFVKPDGSMVDYKTGEPTNLRCNRCGRPITLKSSQSTSVGYRCNICIREIEDGFYEATTSDYIVSSLVVAVLSLIVGIISGFIGGGGFFFIIIAFAVGGGIGTGIARLAQQSIGRRRGRGLSNLLSVLMVLFMFIPGVVLGSFLISAILSFAAASAARVQLR